MKRIFGFGTTWGWVKYDWHKKKMDTKLDFLEYRGILLLLHIVLKYETINSLNTSDWSILTHHLWFDVHKTEKKQLYPWNDWTNILFWHFLNTRTFSNITSYIASTNDQYKIRKLFRFTRGKNRLLKHQHTRVSDEAKNLNLNRINFTFTYRNTLYVIQVLQHWWYCKHRTKICTLSQPFLQQVDLEFLKILLKY